MSSTTQLLAGRYELGEVIGRGGMSTVHRARDRVLGRAVAVKVLSRALADSDATNVARFEREARAAASLSHRSVVAIYDTGIDDDEARYIVMELVHGDTLAHMLGEHAPLPPARAARIAAGVAEALAAAHAAGIVHRDIKPSNVMLADDGTVKVLDFGIARALAATSITRTSTVLGTASYMAPEQALGKPVDERSDIYSLGCLLYALLAGCPPFRGDTDAAVLHQHVTAAPRPVSDLNPAVPRELAALVTAMIAKAPAQRPHSAAVVGELLRQAAGPRMPERAPTAPTRALAHPRARRAPRRIAALAVLAAVGVLALIVALANSSGSGGGGSPPARATKRSAPPARTAADGTPAQTRTDAIEAVSPPVPPPPAGEQSHEPAPGKDHGKGHGPGPGHDKGHDKGEGD